MDNQLYIEYGELEQRARQLEADCAAMRGALEQAHDLYDCAGIEGDSAARGLTEREKLYADKAKEILANMQQALSSSAGKALLEKVQRLEAVAEAAKELGKEIGNCQCEAVWCTKARSLKQALAALEGGAGDAKD